MSIEMPQLDLPSMRASDGRTMIGHVVVCRAGVGAGEDTIATWQVDTEGLRTGAWVEPAESLLVDSEAARKMLLRCRKRALLAWSPAVAIEVLRELEEVAGVTPVDWAARVVTIPDVVAEVAEIRSAYSARVVEVQATRKVKSLGWQLLLPDSIPDTPEALERLAGLSPLTAPNEAATEALTIGRLTSWVVQRWRETTSALGRPYLRATFREPTVLPPRWEARVADAFAGTA